MAKAGVLLLTLWTCFLLPCDVSAATYDNLDTLVTALFTSYNEKLRPFVDDSNPTEVHISLLLKTIEELSAVDESLSFNAILDMYWTDTRLTWTPSSYNNTMYFAYPQKSLWIPDVSIINSVDTLEELGFDRNYLYVESNGRVSWKPEGTFTISCSIDVTYYPFDDQTCSIEITTLVSQNHEISLTAGNADLAIYSTSNSWDLQSFESSSTTTSTKTMITFTLVLHRMSTYHVLAIIIPVLFLSLTATLVFALPADSGEKMGTSITVLLAFAVYLSIVSDQMPQTSASVSVLSLYLSVLLGQTALGVVLSTWILNLHFRDDEKEPPGPRMCKIAVWLMYIMRKRSRKNRVVSVREAQPAPDLQTPRREMDPADSYVVGTSPLPPKAEKAFAHTSPADSDCSRGSLSSEEQETLPWKEIAYVFDRFIFYVSSISITVASAIFLAVLCAHSA